MGLRTLVLLCMSMYARIYTHVHQYLSIYMYVSTSEQLPKYNETIDHKILINVQHIRHR